MTKYRIKFIYATPEFQKASHFMRQLDLWTDGTEAGIEQTWEFTCKLEHAVSFLKDKITEFAEESGLKILHIEGGKIE